MEEFTGTEILSGGRQEGRGPESLPGEGDTIAGRYLVLSVLGRGGSSVVFRCSDQELHREVALKMLVNASPETEARLRREALLGSGWEHPHLLRLYDLGIWEDTPFITMPVAEGGTLADRIKEKGALRPDEVAEIAVQVLEGLSLLHREGFVHRDIKPSNIFFDSDGNARLGDFGIVFGITETRYTSDGFRVGTPQYMSPEYLSGQRVTPASDLWSLGVTLRDSLGDNEAPKWFRKWLSGLVQADPSRRFRDASRALDALLRKKQPPHVVRGRLVMAGALLLIAAFSAAGYALWIAAFSRRAATVAHEGNSISGYSPSGKLVWSREFPARVTEAADFDERAGSLSRFLVLYGGAYDSISAQRVTPHAAILSADGETVSDTDFLALFNPFEGRFSSELFAAEILRIEDLDSDGYPEAWVNCKHNMYPDILYFVSAREKRCTGAFANSGHIYEVAAGGNPRGFARTRFAYMLAVNNRMGHQNVVIPCNKLNGFCLSPDQDALPDTLLHFPYRPASVAFDKIVSPVTVNGKGELELNLSDGTSLVVNPGGDFVEGGRRLSGPGDMRAAGVYLESFYLTMARLKAGFGDGIIESGLEEAKKFLASVEDPNLLFSAQCLLSQVLVEKGFPGAALELMPVDPSKCPNPGSAALKRGEALILAGRYGEALPLLLSARDQQGINLWYGMPGVVACELLEGADASRVERVIKEDYPTYVANSSCGAWMLQAGMLREEAAGVLEEVEREMPQLYSRTNSYDEIVLFPFMGAIWRALASVDAGRPMPAVPDEKALEAAGERERLRELRLLKAYRLLKEKGGAEALDALKRSREELSAAARRESPALVPFTLASYAYGFACMDSGTIPEGVASLKEAVRLYPHGPKARRAAALIKKHG